MHSDACAIKLPQMMYVSFYDCSNRFCAVLLKRFILSLKNTSPCKKVDALAYQKSSQEV